jgi:hypothetical protein
VEEARPDAAAPCCCLVARGVQNTGENLYIFIDGISAGMVPLKKWFGR